MKTYEIVVRTSYYKTIRVMAKDVQQAREAAWEHIGDNDPTENADVDTDFYDIEEVTE
jgi:hypothetical protein